MSGIENIISKIKSDSEIAVNETTARAEKQASEIREKLVAEAKAEAEKIISGAEEKAENITKLSESRCEKLKKQCILTAKVNLINQTVSDALTEIENTADESYFDFLLKILASNIQSGECTMYLNEKDAKRVTPDFEEKAKKIAADKNAVLSISADSSDIKNGFYLKYGDIDINCTLDALAQSKKEELFETVNNILFQAVKEN